MTNTETACDVRICWDSSMPGCGWEWISESPIAGDLLGGHFGTVDQVEWSDEAGVERVKQMTEKDILEAFCKQIGPEKLQLLFVNKMQVVVDMQQW